MAKIRWSLEAFERFKNIKEFIGKESPAASEKFAQGIINQIENISTFPKMGKSAFSELYPNLRLLIWKNYKIYYEYNDRENVIEVWGIWDSRSMLSDF